MNFEINESGRIWLRPLLTGEMSINYSGSGRVVDVFLAVCHPEKSYWHHGTHAVVIKSHFVWEAILELGKASKQINLD